MNTFIKKILIQTKKACVGRLVLLEVASRQVILLSYANVSYHYSFTPRILRGNTQALEKLLLHTSIKSIILSTKKVKSYSCTIQDEPQMKVHSNAR